MRIKVLDPLRGCLIRLSDPWGGERGGVFQHYRQDCGSCSSPCAIPWHWGWSAALISPEAQRGERICPGLPEEVLGLKPSKACVFFKTPEQAWRLALGGKIFLISGGGGFLQTISASWPASEGMMGCSGWGEAIVPENAAAPCGFLYIIINKSDD